MQERLRALKISPDPCIREGHVDTLTKKFNSALDLMAEFVGTLQPMVDDYAKYAERNHDELLPEKADASEPEKADVPVVE